MIYKTWLFKYGRYVEYTEDLKTAIDNNFKYAVRFGTGLIYFSSYGNAMSWIISNHSKSCVITVNFDKELLNK